jgi:hypothetical protein
MDEFPKRRSQVVGKFFNLRRNTFGQSETGLTFTEASKCNFEEPSLVAFLNAPVSLSKVECDAAGRAQQLIAQVAGDVDLACGAVELNAELVGAEVLHMGLLAGLYCPHKMKGNKARQGDP